MPKTPSINNARFCFLVELHGCKDVYRNITGAYDRYKSTLIEHAKRDDLRFKDFRLVFKGKPDGWHLKVWLSNALETPRATEFNLLVITKKQIK